MKFSIKYFMILQGAVRNVFMAVRRLLGRGFRNPLPLLIPGFRHWPPFWRHFVQNICVGIFIECLVILGVILNFGPVVHNQTAALDWMMRLSVNLNFKGGERPEQLWIDVDEKTYRSKEWGGGEPSSLPYEPLTKLIKFAMEHGKYVVIDFALDGKGKEDQQKLLSFRLKNLLATYPDRHLIMMRTVRESLNGRAPSLRPSQLDGLFAANPDRVHAAAPHFIVADDAILRHWKLWESVCREGNWMILPSPQLIVAALLKREKGQKQEWPLWATWSESDAPPCASDDLDGEHVDARAADLMAGRWVYDSFGSCYQQGLINSTDCKQGFQGSTGDQRNPELGMDLGNRVYFRISSNSSLPENIKLLPARYVLDVDNKITSAITDKIKKYQVVIIGGSYNDSRDFHFTPLGRMPGALVLVNSIDSLSTVGIMQGTKTWLKLVVVAVILLLVSAIFALLPSFWAATTLMGGVVLVMAPISFWLFMEQGVWLDFAAPIIGIYLHREWEELHERLQTCMPKISKEE